MQDLVRIKNFSSRLEAEMQKEILEANNIHAVVSAEDAAGMRPDLMMGSGGVWLLVAFQDAEKALQILTDQS